MNKQSRGLGRGLEALIPTMSEQEVVKELLITDIVANKYQPRNEFNEEALEELAESINQYGLLQPVIVRKVLNGYELIAGERRWRAAQKNGAKTIPAIVREYSDIETTEIALIENLQRENLNAIEEAGAYQRLVNEFGLTQEELAKKIVRIRSHIDKFFILLYLEVIVV